MPLSPDLINRHLNRAVHITMALVICWGFTLVLAQIKPFWMDEWRLVYNLKFKALPALFGPLDYTQQFPRVYLVLLKLFAAPFDYSYFTLRFPAFITGVGSIILSYRLMNRLYPASRTERYLFLLIIIASAPFLKYLVQTKQYQMDIFLSLLALWQLLSLEDLRQKYLVQRRRYLWLCFSFLAAPFFSYTYPIAVAPVLLLSATRALWPCIYHRDSTISMPGIWRQLLPLCLCMVSILVFYFIDVWQVLKDNGMNCYWQDHMMSGRENTTAFCRNIWAFLGAAGSGALYKTLFAFLSLAGLFTALRYLRSPTDTGTQQTLSLHYACLLVLLIILLFAAGKLPLGEARLNAFSFPAIAILVVYCLHMFRTSRYRKPAGICCVILYAGLFGNVLSILVKTFTNKSYAKAVTIYSNTEDAIIYAQEHGLPIVISPDVAYPDNVVDEIPCLERIDAASVLKTFPAYKERYQVPVFNIADSKSHNPAALPQGIHKGIVGDGINYRITKDQSR